MWKYKAMWFNRALKDVEQCVYDAPSLDDAKRMVLSMLLSDQIPFEDLIVKRFYL